MICGVDVSQETLEVRIEQGGPGASFSNTKAGIFQLAEFCRVHQVELVAMEASGGYERLALLLLSAEQIPVAILNPGQYGSLPRRWAIWKRPMRWMLG
jgi:transposase